MAKIQGISKSSLWNAWKEVRKQLSRMHLRDVTDYIEYDIDPAWWILRLCREIEGGDYEPATVHRFTLAKKMGFSRRMTQPSIPDLVVYRAVVDYLYLKAKKFEKEHVYFAQNTLSKRVRVIEQEHSEVEPTYRFVSGSALREWIEYDQYRKRLLQDEVFPFIVLTDITNFFDTVLYDRVADALHEIRVDRKLVGLLFFILERLSIRDPFNESPRIGIPVDEFDCSRTLAHMVLFPHDERMTRIRGENAYVRWMDDQNFGAQSYADGLKILQQCGHSLMKLHLTPNAGKSKVLNFDQASRHFHFDTNAALDVIQDMPRKSKVEREAVRSALRKTWRESKVREGTGEWGKVLRRFYRLAGLCGAKLFQKRAQRDVLNEPTLADRISDYIRVTGTAGDYLRFVHELWEHPEQVYPDVNRVMMEGLLLVEPSKEDSQEILHFAADLLDGKLKIVGWKQCAALAPLLILRYGDRRSLPRLKRHTQRLKDSHHPAIAKAVVAVYASFGKDEYREVVNAASRLQDNYLAHFLQMLNTSREYREVPTRFKIRRELINDTVAARKRVDIRKLLALRLLKLNDRKAVKRWVDESREWILRQNISDFEKALVNRLLA